MITNVWIHYIVMDDGCITILHSQWFPVCNYSVVWLCCVASEEPPGDHPVVPGDQRWDEGHHRIPGAPGVQRTVSSKPAGTSSHSLTGTFNVLLTLHICGLRLIYKYNASISNQCLIGAKGNGRRVKGKPCWVGSHRVVIDFSLPNQNLIHV